MEARSRNSSGDTRKGRRSTTETNEKQTRQPTFEELYSILGDVLARIEEKAGGMSLDLSQPGEVIIHLHNAGYDDGLLFPLDSGGQSQEGQP